MITPVLHRLIVKPCDLEEANEIYKKMKELGLARPEHTDTKREEKAVTIGTVIAMGDTCFRDFGATLIPKVGDEVYYAKYSGAPVRDGEIEYIILNDDDIIGIVTK